jgi:uncharacterized surface protein with fasciclin (FAS1) repeats
MKNAMILTAAALLLFQTNSYAQECPSSCSKSQANTGFVNTSAPMTMEKNIVETAAGNADFSTLVAAVKAADLAGALSGEGPFTVFAPTNAAFAKLPAGTVDTLLKPENKSKLASILKYHVVSGKIMAGDVLKAAKVTTLQGQSAPIGLTIGGANIIKTDIKCSNGVIHVIDAVILPKEGK